MFPTDLKCLSDWKLKAFFNSFDVIFCDCDGVILSQQNVLSGIPDAIYALKQIGKKIMYVTNNTSISRRKMQEIFKRAAINVDVNDVINPAVAIGAYFQKIQFTKKVFVIGLPGLREDLTSSGVDIANEAYVSVKFWIVVRECCYSFMYYCENAFVCMYQDFKNEVPLAIDLQSSPITQACTPTSFSG